MAEIVLISPRFSPSYWGWEHALPMLRAKALFPPIGLPLLAALTPPGHSVSIIDENVEAIDWDRCARADIVGLTGMNVQRERMHEILAELKRRGAFVVIGGPWVSVYEQDFGGRPDAIFVGEAEETWPRFLAEWSEGRHQRRYEQAAKTDMATVPTPRFDLLPMHEYLYGGMQISRGCPFTCEFCDIIVVFGRRPRVKRPEQVIRELDQLAAAGKRDIFIADDNLVGNKRAIKPILREIAAWQKAHSYKVSLATEASIDLAEDEEMLRLMAEANIDAVFIGIESTNEASLRETRKIQNLSDRAGTLLDKVRRIQAAGIMVTCGLIVGFDNDDESVFESHRRFAEQARIPQAMVNVLLAIPRTPLFERLLREGRLLGDGAGTYWGSGAFFTNVIPLRMDRGALLERYVELVRDLYAPEAFFSRIDALCLEAGWLPASGRTAYLKRHPLRRLARSCAAAIQAAYVFAQLMRRVPDAALRRQYRGRLLKVLTRRPNPRLLRMYCVYCAIHFHYDHLIRQMAADRAGFAIERDRAGTAPAALSNRPGREASAPRRATARSPG